MAASHYLPNNKFSRKLSDHFRRCVRLFTKAPLVAANCGKQDAIAKILEEIILGLRQLSVFSYVESTAGPC